MRHLYGCLFGSPDWLKQSPMDALMAALVAALLTQASDRTPWIAAALGDRYPAKGAVIAGTALALALGNALAVLGGIFAAPLLSPNARDLLLALALVSGGVTAFWPPKRAVRGRWRFGGFASSVVAIGLLGLGDRTQFVTAALAARSATPTLGAFGAAVGAVIGALTVNIPAILVGEQRLRTSPTGSIRIGAAALLTIGGTIEGLSALRLI